MPHHHHPSENRDNRPATPWLSGRRGRPYVLLVPSSIFFNVSSSSASSVLGVADDQNMELGDAIPRSLRVFEEDARSLED